jgi:hypothetical protein
MDRLPEENGRNVANLPAPDSLVRRSLKTADPALAIGIGNAKEKGTAAKRLH